MTPTFRDYLSVPFSRVKLSLNILTLKYGTIGSPKTSVSNNITPRNNPNDRKIQGFVYFRENGQDEGGGGENPRNFFTKNTLSYGPRDLSRYRDSLRAGESGYRIPVGAKMSASVQTGNEAHTIPCTVGTGFLSRG